MNQIPRRIGVVLVLALGASLLPLAAFPQGMSFHLLEEFSGKVELKRATWEKFQPIKSEKLLRDDDRLRLTSGARVKILCRNREVWMLQSSGEYGVSDRCPRARRVNGSERAPTRTIFDATIPYIISPRNSFVLSDRPLLRWNPVTGVRKYRVQISGFNWEMETSETQIRYSGEPPLEPGMRYRLVVEADNGKTSRQGDEVTGFTVLDSSTAQQVASELGQLKQQQLSKETCALASASVYLEYGLTAEAIEVLRETIAQGIRSASVYQLLGELYFQSGLEQLARSPWEEALQLARSLEDVEGQALALTGLGEVEELLGNDDKAIAYFEEAQSNYEQLGDRQEVAKLREAIQELK